MRLKLISSCAFMVLNNLYPKVVWKETVNYPKLAKFNRDFKILFV